MRRKIYDPLIPYADPLFGRSNRFLQQMTGHPPGVVGCSGQSCIAPVEDKSRDAVWIRGGEEDGEQAPDAVRYHRGSIAAHCVENRHHLFDAVFDRRLLGET
jgi:hypothetical protein